MVGVVGLGHAVGDGQLQLVRPEPVGLAHAREPEAGTEVQQDRCGLADHDVAIDQEGRRERGPWVGRIVEPAPEIRFAAACGRRLARHVDIGSAGGLERQADEFAAALDGGPVVKLIGQASSA